MFRGFLLFVFSLCLAYPAWGSGPAKKADKPEPGTAVEMPFLMVPMIKDGELIGYSYVASKLICTSPPACVRIREKLAFIQDAFVREVNGRPAALTSDPHQFDKEQLSARLTVAARRILGQEAVRGMIFVEMKFAPLHPSDSTSGTVPPEQSPAQTSPDGAGKPDGAAKSAGSEGATSKPVSGPSH